MYMLMNEEGYIVSKVTGLVCTPVKFHDLSTPEGFIALHKRNYQHEWLLLKINANVYRVRIKGSVSTTLNTVEEDGSVYIAGLGRFPLRDFEFVEF